MYLWLHRTEPHPHFSSVVSTDPSLWFNYKLYQEGWAIYRLWSWRTAAEDKFLCGVWADWLDDHRSALLTGATGPSDPAVRLDELVLYLRQRFNACGSH